MWIIIAAGIVGAVIAVVVRRRGDKESDLGWVTEAWLAEHRADQAAHLK